MQPAPLTGTATLQIESDVGHALGDAACAPHGDGNDVFFVFVFNDKTDAARTPHGDGNALIQAMYSPTFTK